MNLKGLLAFIRRESRDESYKMILWMTIISGLANASLLAIINKGSGSAVFGDFNYRYIAIFAIVFAIFLMTKNRALALSNVLAENIVFNVRERIVQYLLKTELVKFEELGRAEIYTRLTKDTNEISGSASILANAIQSSILVFFAIIYLAFINKIAFVITIGMLGLAIANFFTSGKKVQGQIWEAVKIETNYFETIDEITGGFKEVKLNQKKKKGLFIDKVQVIANKVRNQKVTTSKLLSFFFVYSQATFYILLGTLVFVAPVLDKSVMADITKITATILFIIGPLENLIGTFEVINKTNVAISNLTDLEDRLASNVGVLEDMPIAQTFRSFNTIALNDASFAYHDKNGKKVFGIGPVNFQINRGEIVFIIGGNGSGKSTFIKLLLGLYQPESGYITVNGEEVTELQIQEYRELYSAIFTDFFLFKELYGSKDVSVSEVNLLIQQMQLTGKTTFSNGAFTNVSLSTGQRKRLAMIVTMLENKEVLVFDEWAADQDPEFRKYFYEELLPAFKKMGKTVIAITHDDHYFQHADKLYRMDYGKLSQI